jgi:tetratricopeptide (TPR) repeat protein
MVCGVLHAADYEAGDKIIVVKDGSLQLGGRNVGRVSMGAVLRIHAVSGRMLMVGQAQRGWLDPEHAIPLDRRAYNHFTTLVRREPKNGQAIRGRAAVWQELGELDRAINDMNEAIPLAPTAWNYLYRGILWKQKQDHDKAIEDFGQALRLSPRYGSAYSHRALSHIQKKDYEAALTDADEAVRLNPRDAWAYIARASAWRGKKDYEKAISNLRQATSVQPDSSDAKNSLAWFLATCPEADFRDGEQALELATKACEQTQWKVASHLDTLAAAYAETGDFEQAEKWQQKAFDLAAPREKEKYQPRVKLYRDKKPYRDEGESE